MSNEIRLYVNELKNSKGLTVTEIAKEIGYTREHLGKQMKSEKANPAIMALLREKYGEIPQPVVIAGDLSKTIGSLHREVIALKSGLAALVDDYCAYVQQQGGPNAGVKRRQLAQIGEQLQKLELDKADK